MPIAGADAIPFVVKGYDDAKRLWDLQKPLLNADFKRLGEAFSLEWLRAVGPDANKIFIPYYSQR